MTVSAASTRRILLALDAITDLSADFATLAALAAQLDADLHALFVEDADLLHLAALPFAREVGLVSAARRRLSNPQMEKTLQRRSLRAQQVLAAAAARANVRWTFATARGQISVQIARAVLEADILVLAGDADPVRHAHARAVMKSVWEISSCPVLLLPPGSGLRAPFVAVYDATDAGQRALEHAIRLARPEHAAVQVLLAPATAREAPALQASVQALLAANQATGKFHVLRTLDSAALAQALRKTGIGTLSMAAASPLYTSGSISSLLTRTGLAVLLVP
jgi:nucleotide-binding universal stress UspA family protein